MSCPKSLILKLYLDMASGLEVGLSAIIGRVSREVMNKISILAKAQRPHYLFHYVKIAKNIIFKTTKWPWLWFLAQNDDKQLPVLDRLLSGVLLPARTN